MTESTEELRGMIAEARARIANEINWTAGANARNAKGHQVGYNNPTACRWCAGGSLRASGVFSPLNLFNALGVFPPGSSLIEFNDTHSHREVIALFDKAIAACEASTSVKSNP